MNERELGTLVDEMSLQEQVSLLSGEDFWSTAGRSNGWRSASCASPTGPMARVAAAR